VLMSNGNISMEEGAEDIEKAVGRKEFRNF
jgi:hypothetical protein